MGTTPNERRNAHRRASLGTSIAILFALTTGACGGRSASVGGPSDASAGQDGSVADSATDATSDRDSSSEEDARPAHDASQSDAADGGGTDSGAIDGGDVDARSVVPIDHRPDDSQCATARPAGTCVPNLSSFMCSSDSDCVDAGANGRCDNGSGGPAYCLCTYDRCQADSDCNAGEVCVCHGSAFAYGGNTCMLGNCRVDSDCGVGGYCSPAHGPTNCGHVSGYYCHTPNDECTNDSDCAGTMFRACTWSSTAQHWTCQVDELCE